MHYTKALCKVLLEFFIYALIIIKKGKITVVNNMNDAYTLFLHSAHVHLKSKQ